MFSYICFCHRCCVYLVKRVSDSTHTRKWFYHRCWMLRLLGEESPILSISPRETGISLCRYVVTKSRWLRRSESRDRPQTTKVSGVLAKVVWWMVFRKHTFSCKSPKPQNAIGRFASCNLDAAILTPICLPSRCFRGSMAITLTKRARGPVELWQRYDFCGLRSHSEKGFRYDLGMTLSDPCMFIVEISMICHQCSQQSLIAIWFKSSCL